MSKTVLVVAAHTDDEALGCGGTIARHVADGDRVYAAFLADGVSSRPDSQPGELAKRNEAAEEAHKILGISDSFLLGFPDNCLDTVALLDIVQALEGIIQKTSPTIIYTHHCGDLNIDHQIAHRAVVTACRPVPGAAVREIYAFEVLSSTEWNTPGLFPFLPNHFVDIEQSIDQKLASLDAYRLEMRDSPHSRSMEHVRALARSRGNSVGRQFAEAFMAIRVLR